MTSLDVTVVGIVVSVVTESSTSHEGSASSISAGLDM